MPLETFAQAKLWAPVIKVNVSRRVMPPWHLDPTIGIQEYKNDFSLSNADIATLVAWVDAGAPEGDPSRLPPPVDWPNWLEWELEGLGVRVGFGVFVAVGGTGVGVAYGRVRLKLLIILRISDDNPFTSSLQEA